MSEKIITKYAQMWPREVFDIRKGKSKLLPEIKDLLSESGVYILYRDDRAYYIGQTSGKLIDRIYAHANKPKDRCYNFWNFFSAFVIPDKEHLGEIEGALIAATMTPGNRAVPAIKRIDLPTKVATAFHQKRIFSIDSD